MPEYEVLSVDMFQTLVNVNSRITNIWKRILGEDYSLDLAIKYASLLNELVYKRFHRDVNQSKKFLNLKSIFKKYFSEVFLKINLDFSPEVAADIFASEHNLAVPYSDTKVFFEIIEGILPICLVSDSDIDMISSHIEEFKFDKVFISESVKAYKNQHDGNIFKKVIEHYDVKPDKILHIGDASSDIIGANRVGIKTCWINRNKDEWKHEIKPTYIIYSLEDVVQILGLDDEQR